jgi:hypothetical protein
MIIMKDTAQNIATMNGALGRCLREGNRRLLLKPLMWARVIVVVHIRNQHAPQMSFTEDEQAI